MIALKEISKKFPINKKETITALDKVNLSFNEGEVIVLKGASGSGKSTILSLIAGLSKPTSGEVTVDQKRISKLPDSFLARYRRENIGFIFQKYNLVPNLTAGENIILPLVPNNPDSEALEKKMDRVLKMFEIFDKKGIPVMNLSGGEQQRCGHSQGHDKRPKDNNSG